MSHKEGGENFRSRSSSKCNQMIKRLEFNENFETFCMWESQSFCLKLRLKCGRNKRAQIKECIEKISYGSCVINKGYLTLTFI